MIPTGRCKSGPDDSILGAGHQDVIILSGSFVYGRDDSVWALDIRM